MNDIIKAIHRFDDHRVTTLSYRGRPAWLAREVGAALGYAYDGKRFASQISREWSDEFIDGTDFAVLTGNDAAVLVGAVTEGTETVPLGTGRVLVLFESGMYLALAKTEKEAGIRFRRFMIDEVMPQIARTGAYQPKEAPPAPERQTEFTFVAVAVPVPVSVPTLAVERERRLCAQHNLRARKFQVDTLQGTVRSLAAMQQIDPTTRAAYEVAAAEIALGQELPELRPVAFERWYSPTQIAKMAGVTSHAVGLAITRLELRGVAGMSRSVVAKALHVPDKLVYSWVYTDVAVRRILAELRGAPSPSA